MQAVMNPKYPGLSVRVADEGFDAYVWGNDFSFEVSAYGVPEMGKCVDQWALERTWCQHDLIGTDMPDPDARAPGRRGIPKVVASPLNGDNIIWFALSVTGDGYLYFVICKTLKTGIFINN